QGSWCPQCAYTWSYTLEDAKRIALSRHGQCLSNKYINIKLPLLWRCIKGPEWKANFGHIREGHWCPYCAGNAKLTLANAKQIAIKNGGLCVSEKYINSNSIRRSDFLKTSEHSRGLELDIYYPEYGFAIEVQGQQHEKYIKFFHRSDPNNFIKQQAQDQLKKELCEENWIAL
ncbi:19179_t:CDS:2, partial [Racocetra fulgida]